MLRLTPVLKDYLWGGYKMKKMFGRDNGGGKISESWEASVHRDGRSLCEEIGKPDGQAFSGTLADYIAARPDCLGDKTETVAQAPRSDSARGTDFPVLVKYIDAADNLSVQVHPDDAYARRVENDNGKTEMWYVLQADEGAGIYCGFRRDTTKEEFLARAADGTVEELLNFIPVSAGDCYLVRAGTVHAIGAGCVICEIQQSSNVTYRVYDYNRRGADGKLRPLHVDKAAEVIDYSAFRDRTGSGAPQKTQGGAIRLLTFCEYFRCRELILKGEYRAVAADSFVVVNVLDGRGTVNGCAFSAGDSFFASYGEGFTLEGEAKIILTDAPRAHTAAIGQKTDGCGEKRGEKA